MKLQNLKNKFQINHNFQITNTNTAVSAKFVIWKLFGI